MYGDSKTATVQKISPAYAAALTGDDISLGYVNRRGSDWRM